MLALALGVVMDPKTRMQRFFDLHTDGVLALAMHPTGAVVATRKSATDRPSTCGAPRIARASPPSSRSTARRRCTWLSSADGYNLAAVGADELHTVSVYDWESNAQKKSRTAHAHLPDAPYYAGKLVASEQFGRAAPYVVKFNPVDGRLVIGGRLCLKFYVLDGDALRCTPAAYAHGARKGYAQASILSLTFTMPDGSTFGGTLKGDVYKYEEGGARRAQVRAPAPRPDPRPDLHREGAGERRQGRQGEDVERVHAGRLPAEHRQGCRDAPGRTLGAAELQQRQDPCCRAVASTPDARTLAVGISASEIYEFSLDVVGDFLQKEELATRSARLALQGHCGFVDHKTGDDEGDVWAVATHPKLPFFATTVGEDRSVRIWSLKEKRMLRHARLPAKGRSVAWHPAGGAGCDHVAVGTTTGKVVVVDVERGGTVAAAQHAPENRPCWRSSTRPAASFWGWRAATGASARWTCIAGTSSWTRRTS